METKAVGVMAKYLVLPGRFSRHGSCGISKLNTLLQNRYYPLINTAFRWWVMTHPWTSAKVSFPSLNAS